MLRLGGAARLLTGADLPALRPLLDRDPVAHCFVASRVEAAGLDPWRLGAELWGYGGIRLEAACFSGANLVPVGDAPAALAAFADRARRQGRRCSSIVGPAHAVGALWDRLAPYWGPAREVRATQPLLATSTEPPVAGDPAVRRVSLAELDILMPACVAMFTEEVGTSPLGNDNGAAYRARVRDLVLGGRAFARIEGGEVLFKAELGAVSGRVCAGAGRLGRPRRTAAAGWARRHRRGRRRGAAHGRAGGQPVRQRLQPAGPPGVRAGRLRRTSAPSASVLF